MGHVTEAIVGLLGKFGLPHSSPPGGSLLSVVAWREARQYTSHGRGEEGDVRG